MFFNIVGNYTHKNVERIVWERKFLKSFKTNSSLLNKERFVLK